MPCLVPTALTVLLGLLAVAFGAGMALLGYLPTMEAFVEVRQNASDADISSNPEASPTTRGGVSTTPSPVINVVVSSSSSSSKQLPHSNIVLNNSALAPTSTSTLIFSMSSGSESGSSSLLTNNPSYQQPSIASTKLPHDHQQPETNLQEVPDSNNPNLDASITTLSITTSTTTTVAADSNEVAVKRQMNNGRFLALRACSYAGPVVMAIGMFAMIMACVFYCELLDKYAILVPDKGHGSDLQKDELYQVHFAFQIQE